MADINTLPPHPKSRGPFYAIYDLFSNVWFGITLMVLLFLYMSVASAGILYPMDSWKPFGPWNIWVARKYFGKTEMEVFAWWPFNLMMALLVVNMVVVTLRRIRLTVLSAGVWMIHFGIVILILGSVYYFGNKIEGDTPVFRRSIVIDVPGIDHPQRILVRTNNQWAVTGSAGEYSFTIAGINPAWPLLSGDDKGKTACSVNVAVTTPTQSFIRQMLIGYPQYTEDIIPGKGRAIKSTGKKLLDDSIKLTFVYEPQTQFYLMDSAALYVRKVGDTEWVERPINGLPHYAEHVSSRNDVWLPPTGVKIEPGPLNINVEKQDDDDPLGKIDVHITGRLHYSPEDERRWVPGGEHFNPMMRVLLTSDGKSSVFSLFDAGSTARKSQNERVKFHWTENDRQRESHGEATGDKLIIKIPEEDVEVRFHIDEDNTFVRNDKLEFTAIEGTDWSYRIKSFHRSVEVTRGHHAPVVVVEMKSGERQFTRWATDDPTRARDASGDQAFGAPDPSVEVTLRPGSMITFVSGPDPADIEVFVGRTEDRRRVTIGEPLDIGSGLTLAVQESYSHARIESRPVVVAKLDRDPKARNIYSRIKLELSLGDWSFSDWLSFHRYPFSSEQYAIPGRFPYHPTRCTLPDGTRVELLFSRERRNLPRALALDDFELKVHTGGFVERNMTSVRDFISVLKPYQNGEWSAPVTTSLNKPAEIAGQYFFQSEWDPGEMAFTGLGVGNRDGVYIQLLGTCIAVFGMIYVFYIKPVIKRRRQKAVWASVAQTGAEDQAQKDMAKQLVDA
ncbi:MAG: hypothetical protein GXP29_00565 [Planctomycetes bacterium]|nr:hypothetical protein [Planctomycetota bacterium]